jgi:hypothetical protein
MQLFPEVTKISVERESVIDTENPFYISKRL